MTSLTSVIPSHHVQTMHITIQVCHTALNITQETGCLTIRWTHHMQHFGTIRYFHIQSYGLIHPCLILQCFHLQTPEPLAKQRLQQSVSLPAFSSTQLQQHVNLSTRPLPRTPGLGRDKQEKFFLLRKSSEGSQLKIRRKEPLRRTTVHSFSQKSSQSKDLLRTRLFEDHIYEEIDEVGSRSDYSDDTDDSGISGKESEENSFLSLISTTRRQNLRYYGCTDWDFGTERV